MDWRGIWTKLTGAFSASPVGAVAGAVGGIAGAVRAGEELADHKQLLAAGAAEGTIADVAKTQARVDDAAASLNDQRLRISVNQTRFRD